MKKIWLTVFVFVGFVGIFLLFQNRGANYDGEITIIIHDGIEITSEETILFNEGDALLDLLNEQYNLVCANASYKPSSECQDLFLGSPVILEIDGIKTNWIDTYFAIYVNDTYSNLGVDMINLNDGDIIRFEVQEVGGE